MQLKIATWNINSVRLRAGLVARFLQDYEPDVLCLQETKCPMGQFPSSAFADPGYVHIAECGQPGYHGVAIVSRIPFETTDNRQFCGKQDARHVSAVLSGTGGIEAHSLYVPAGGDVPDPETSEKFAHKLQFLTEMRDWFNTTGPEALSRSVLTGDLNVAPLEHDVWSHKALLKVVSHTPIEVDHLAAAQKAGCWHDAMRQHVPADEKLYTWWSYRARDWNVTDKGRRLDHVWLGQGLADRCRHMDVLREVRGWDKPSDHAPVIATLDV